MSAIALILAGWVMARWADQAIDRGIPRRVAGIAMGFAYGMFGAGIVLAWLTA